MKRLLVLITALALLCGCAGTSAVNKEKPVVEMAAVATVESATPTQTTAPKPTPTAKPTVTAIATATPTQASTVTPSPSMAQEVAANFVKIRIKDADNTDILPLTEIAYEEGQTVFNVLLSVTKDREMQMEFSGGKKTAYIKGINNLYEFDKGSTSGWKYSVNGVFPQKSCGAYIVKKGDIIEWNYTLE